MPSRIEHKIIRGTETKRCGICEKYLPLPDFHTVNNTWDGLFYACRGCYNEKRRLSPRRNALKAYRQMLSRVEEDSDYLARGTEVKIGRSEFVDWYTASWFPGAHVDRIDNAGHYESGNMQMLSIGDHNAKLRQDRLYSLAVAEPEGGRYCYGCGTAKSSSDFGRKKSKMSSSNPAGLDEHCRECRRTQRRTYYRRKNAND